MGMSAGAAATSNGTLEELSTVEGGTWEGDGDEEDEVDYPDSDDEEDEETLLLREEVWHSQSACRDTLRPIPHRCAC